MQELKEMFLEVAIIFAKNFSDALLLSASQILKLKEANSQASIIESQKQPREIENPKLESLAIGDYVMISVIYRKQSKRYGCTITNIEGEKITVTNEVIQKTSEVSPQQVLYKFLNGYDIK